MTHFWHSKTQALHFANNNKRICAFKKHYALINGEVVLYTTMNNTNKRTCLYYEDSEYLGEGDYLHSDGAW